MISKNIYLIIISILCVMYVSGCQTSSGNVVKSARVDTGLEPKWIRDGEPIEFQGEKWYPADGVEVLLESELYLMGQFNGVKFFVDKVDIQPYSRLYTKFDKNKYRYFEKRVVK
jgi:hypothetical protein